ncbi:uncharacterized protein LOC131680604 [Topomyia yanbarensis]|uniref:uncharacterized protein LOC131680604 n=1 Tax=Topomyia yanbarensis TaxID=2498891 RepID=UPI00273B4277|nr:uncharacterized protein LOC131680604 [Topomyia yanbarensis]
MFKVNLQKDTPNTKHQMLSDSARLFDPFGWFAPVIVRAKIMYQQCWLYDLNWHDPLPLCVEELWVEMKQNLSQLEQLRILRWTANYHGRIELHGFSDASEEAYAAVVYLRSVSDINGVHVTLVAARTRVAPVRQISIPRLELNAAELLVKLMKQIAEPLNRFQIEKYAWTDSTIVLQWLSSHPRKWSTYIANRVSSILEILPRRQWGHVPSLQNPADCASRGITPLELVNHSLWWSGPTWLADDSGNWERNVPDEAFDYNTLEICKRFQSLNVSVHRTCTNYGIEKQILDRRSVLCAACRQLAYIKRFIFNLKATKSGQPKRSDCLSPPELHDARLQFARMAQFEVYQNEIDYLLQHSEVFSKSQIAELCPFLDGDGTLRALGRLQQSSYSFEVKHPVILPKAHRFTRLLVEELHLQNCHAGPSLLTATINQRYWIKGC